MAVKFKEAFLHGRVRLLPGNALAFEDPRAEEYFVNLGAATTTTAEPVHTYSAAEIEIDPDTIHADGPNKGRPVLSKEG